MLPPQPMSCMLLARHLVNLLRFFFKDVDDACKYIDLFSGFCGVTNWLDVVADVHVELNVTAEENGAVAQVELVEEVVVVVLAILAVMEASSDMAAKSVSWLLVVVVVVIVVEFVLVTGVLVFVTLTLGVGVILTSSSFPLHGIKVFSLVFDVEESIIEFVLTAFNYRVALFRWV